MVVGRVAGGIGLLLIALFMFAGYLGADLDASAGATFLALAVAVGLPAAGGAALLASHFRASGRVADRKQDLRRQTIDAEVLRLAGQHGGKLTVVEVIGSLALPPDEAKAVLDSLARRELADLEVTDSGVIVYAFHDVARLSVKSKAKGILDA
jgi:hypothetical protein